MSTTSSNGDVRLGAVLPPGTPCAGEQPDLMSPEVQARVYAAVLAVAVPLQRSLRNGVLRG